LNKKDKRISSLWISHLKTDEEKEKFKNYIASSQGVLERLEAILDNKLHVRQVFKEEDYKNPSWAYAQADRNGYVRALKEIKELLKGNDQ
jgi:hypothetical protein